MAPMDVPADLASAVKTVPAGAWAVGVSGGADSVALLLLLRHCRPDLRLHVAHLDHETRSGASAADAGFVADLATRWNLSCTRRRRSDIESSLQQLPRNRSARFRAARLALFRQVIAEQQLDGVLLAHHADDQAETILHRLLRGGGPAALAGMASDTRVGGVRIVRPLLAVDRERLRAMLAAADQPWREDQSNASPQYLRNRLRKILEKNPALSARLAALGRSCGQINAWTTANAPELAERFPSEALAGGGPLARRAAAAWLAGRGVPRDRIDRASCDRLIEMAADAASAARMEFAGGVAVRRRGGVIFAQPPPAQPPDASQPIDLPAALPPAAGSDHSHPAASGPPPNSG